MGLNDIHRPVSAGIVDNKYGPHHAATDALRR